MKKYLIIIVLILCSCSKNNNIEQSTPIKSNQLLNIIEDIEKDIPYQIVEEQFYKDSNMFIYVAFQKLDEIKMLSIYTTSSAPFFGDDIENIENIDINSIGIKGFFRLDNGRKVVIYDKADIGGNFYDSNKLITDSLDFIRKDVDFGKEVLSVNYRIYKIENTNINLKVKYFKTNIKEAY